jgi:hypothetical protein
VSDEQGGSAGEPGGARSGNDAEAWRTLVLGVLERFDQFASVLLDENVTTRRPDGSSGGVGDAATFAAASDFAGQARLAFDTIMDEAGDLLWQLLSQLITILEAVQQALEQVIGSRPESTPPRPTGAGSRGSTYQPIPVLFEPVVDIPRGDP